MEPQIDYESQVALYLAAQIQEENLERNRKRMAEAFDPVTTFVSLKCRE
ncbi:MAG: hypothetical protein AB7F41_15115 [Methylocystis sp.]